MFRKETFRLFIICMFLLLTAAGLSGCTLPTTDTSFPLPEETPQAAAYDARELIQTAVNTMNTSKEAQKFWFNGYVKSSVETRTTTSMYQGIANRPAQAYVVNGRIAAQPFRYYSWAGTKFISDHDVWLRAGKEDILPFDPFLGFTDWLPLMQNASLLKDDTILSNLCKVVQIKISAKEWVEQSASPLFGELKALLGTDQATDELLANSIVKTTLWIGVEDHYIHQYSTWIVMPLPGAGYFDQETYFRYFQFDDPSIDDQLQAPDKVEHWVNHFEEQLKSGQIE
ncbi:MAG TPA: hypothetical protein VGE40_07525 [Bacilli bacterium]